jgi:hypothetical protein
MHDCTQLGREKALPKKLQSVRVICYAECDQNIRELAEAVNRICHLDHLVSCENNELITGPAIAPNAEQSIVGGSVNEVHRKLLGRCPVGVGVAEARTELDQPRIMARARGVVKGVVQSDMDAGQTPEAIQSSRTVLLFR